MRPPATVFLAKSFAEGDHRMRKTTILALIAVSAISFSLGAAYKNINSGHIEALNSILEARSGFQFGFPPDPCKATPPGFPPDPCINLRSSPSAGILQSVEIVGAEGGAPLVQVVQSDPDRGEQYGASEIRFLDPAAVNSTFLITDGAGNQLHLCTAIAQPPPEPR